MWLLCRGNWDGLHHRDVRRVSDREDPVVPHACCHLPGSVKIKFPLMCCFKRFPFTWSLLFHSCPLIRVVVKERPCTSTQKEHSDPRDSLLLQRGEFLAKQILSFTSQHWRCCRSVTMVVTIKWLFAVFHVNHQVRVGRQWCSGQRGICSSLQYRPSDPAAVPSLCHDGRVQVSWSDLPQIPTCLVKKQTYCISKISYSVFFLKISLFSFGLSAIFQCPLFCSLLASLALSTHTHTHISSYFIPYFYGKHVYFQDLSMPKKI